jgi:hypothetical protein
MNVIPEECLRIDRPRRSHRSLPVPPVENVARTDGVAQADEFAERIASRSPVRGRLIVIGFVSAAPIALGAWLWLLGRAVLALL